MSTRPALAAALVSLACIGAQGTDLPFLLGSTAVQEEDEERVYEFSTWGETGSHHKGFTAELEYSFVPDFSMEIGWSRHPVAVGERERETELELGMRKVLRDPARHGLGVALKVEVEASNKREDGAGGSWHYGDTAALLPLSWQWGRTWLHLTPGLRNEWHEGTKPQLVAAFQHPFLRRFEAYGEWGAVRDRDGLFQAGVRWWAMRERMAVDFAGVRRREGSERSETLVLGLTLTDLSL